MARYIDESIDYMNKHKSVIPPAIAVMAAIGLGRMARLATIGMAIAWAARELREMDKVRSDRGPLSKSDAVIDTAMEDSFPASDPPAYSASSAGTPNDQGSADNVRKFSQVH